MAGEYRAGRGLNALLVARPRAAAVVTSLALVMLVSSLSPATSDTDQAPAWLSIAVVVYAAASVAMVVAFPPLVGQRPASVIGALWAFSTAPTLVVASTAFLGTPTWTLAAGLLASIVALGLTGLTTTRSDGAG